MVHFVGFRGDEYLSAVRVWGLPDFYHRSNDPRLWTDVSPSDTVVFANGSEARPHIYSFDDSQHF